MLGLIGVSNIVNRFVPFVPVPLIQVALGAAVSVLPSGIHLALEPELFFILFIAPLLYNDGKHTPRDELWRLRAPILLMAVGLVFLTVFVVGYAIHWMIPTIPLQAAFALAAILSPTDAVAVGALAGRIHLPKSLMRLLEGEALMNDASGLVAFKFAIAAAVTGAFSLPQATVSFLIISIGGLAIGALLALLITVVRKLLRKSGMEDETIHMLLQILTPFLLYLTAEELGMSGILAAVAGGIVHAIEHDRSESRNLKLNAVSTNTWSVILYLLNGLVFVILGTQIPDVSRTILSDPAFDNLRILGYAVVIFAMLLALRFVWVLLFSRSGRFFGRKKEREVPSLKILLMTSVSGVRGAVTLAGAFSIPLVVHSGGVFPERDLIIFLASTVILLSLLAASILLPMLARKKEPLDESGKEQLERQYQMRLLGAALKAVSQERHEGDEAAVSIVMADYERWMRRSERKGDARRGSLRSRKKETAVRLLALAAEREYIAGVQAEGKLSQEHAEQLLRMLEQLEMTLSNRLHLWKVLGKWAWRRVSAWIMRKPAPLRKGTEADWEILRRIKLQSSEAAIRAIRQHSSPGSEGEIQAVFSHYNQLIERLKGLSPAARRNDAQVDEQKKELYWLAIQAERNEAQALYEQGEINREMLNRLRRTISEREAAMLEQEGIG
jgi:CPA1 family monovalent cation:H+ antiporter